MSFSKQVASMIEHDFYTIIYSRCPSSKPNFLLWLRSFYRISWPLHKSNNECVLVLVKFIQNLKRFSLTRVYVPSAILQAKQKRYWIYSHNHQFTGLTFQNGLSNVWFPPKTSVKFVWGLLKVLMVLTINRRTDPKFFLKFHHGFSQERIPMADW